MRRLQTSFIQNKPLVFAALAAAALLAAAASLCFGSSGLSAADTLRALFGQGEASAVAIARHVRAPRTLAAVLCGAGLAVGGAVIQGVLGNPLAGPNIIGVTAGAGFFAILVSAAAPEVYGLVPLAAFVGALAACFLVYGLARRTGASRITLVLAGVAVSSMLSAGIDAVATLAPDAAVGANSFLVGGLSGVTLQRLVLPGALIAAGLLAAFALHTELDILSLGDDVARSVGLAAAPVRCLLLGAAAVLCGASVSFAGLVGFVGLIVPHAARFLVGGESRALLPASALLGAALVAGCDTLARVLFAPFELPVGILLSLLGGPFFLWLLFRQRGGRLS